MKKLGFPSMFLNNYETLVTGNSVVRSQESGDRMKKLGVIKS